MYVYEYLSLHVCIYVSMCTHMCIYVDLQLLLHIICISMLQCLLSLHVYVFHVCALLLCDMSLMSNIFDFTILCFHISHILFCLHGQMRLCMQYDFEHMLNSNLSLYGFGHFTFILYFD